MSAALVLISALLCFSSSAWAAEQAPQKKRFPHPHAVHLGIVEQGTPDFSVDEIAGWPAFIRLFQKKIDALAIGADVRRLVVGARPERLSPDEKAIVVSELNRLLGEPHGGIRRGQAAPESAETKAAAARYRNTQAAGDLRWLHRNLIADVFLSMVRKTRGAELPPITCATCHEGYAGSSDKRGSETLGAPDVDERAAVECFARAVAQRLPTAECVARADALRAARIESRGPLTGIVRKRLAEGDVPLYVALHPEDPDTFKPLLKRLVCTQCHGNGRSVDKVRGRDGEVKQIPIFYGDGFRQVRPETLGDGQAR